MSTTRRRQRLAAAVATTVSGFKNQGIALRMGSCVTWLCNELMKMFLALFGGVHATPFQLRFIEVARPNTNVFHECGSELVHMVHVPPPLCKCK